MSVAIDASVIVASLLPDEPRHVACDRLLAKGDNDIYVHALAETFSTLTGGRGGRRITADEAVDLLEDNVLPLVRSHALTTREVMTALAECQSRGVRGGAVYDYLHLAAARKAAADVLFTLDVQNFRALARKGDPSIEAP